MASRKSRKKAAQKRSLLIATAIALVSAVALVALAANQSTTPETVARSDRRPPPSRAAINAAEERAIWAEPKAAIQQEPAVTIAGCIERHDDGFRLKDATGDAVPKTRSWKTGFFKKGPAPIDLVDARLAASHVGERVRVTGVLTDRDMRVRSIARIASSC